MLCTYSISCNRFVGWDKTRKWNNGMAEAELGKNAEWRKWNGDKTRNGDKTTELYYISGDRAFSCRVSAKTLRISEPVTSQFPSFHGVIH